MDSLKYNQDPPCLTLLRHLGGPSLKRPSSTPSDTPCRMLMYYVINLFWRIAALLLSYQTGERRASTVQPMTDDQCR
jgi:hypothetical protein